MAAERDVTLRIRTATAGDGGKAMQDLAARTREAKAEADRLGKAYQEAGRQAQQAAAGMPRGGGVQVPALAAAPGRTAGVVTGLGGQADKAVGGFASALQGITGGLIGFAAAVKFADSGLRAYANSFEGGKFSSRKFGEHFSESMSGIPLIGFAFENSNQLVAKRERERRLAEARGLVQYQEARGGIQGGLQERMLGLGGQLARYQALAGTGQLQLQDVGGIAGPARQLQQAQAEAAYAARAVAAAQAGAAGAMRGVDVQQRTLSATASEEGKRLARAALEQRIVEANQALLQVQKSQEASLAAQQKRQEAMVQLAQAKIDKLRAEKQTQDSLVEAEKQRLGGAAGQWGGMSAADRMRATQVGGQLARGGIESLSAGDLDFARSVQLFSRTIQEQQQSRGEQDQAFQDLVRLLGEDRKLAQAQQVSVEIDNKITAEIKVNEATLAQQLQTQVTPVIQSMVQTAMQQAQLEMQRLMLQMRANRPA